MHGAGLRFLRENPNKVPTKRAYEQAKEKESTAPVEVIEEEEVVEEDEVTPISKPRTSSSNVSTRTEKINAAEGEDASRLQTLQRGHWKF